LEGGESGEGGEGAGECAVLEREDVELGEGIEIVRECSGERW